MRPALAAAAAAAIAAGCSGCTSGSSGDNGASSASGITGTTQIAGAGVLGNQRRPDESCAPEPAAADAGPAPRTAHNAAGVEPDTAEVPDDPQRIVVLSGDQLDALCALGLQSRIVGAALPAGSSDEPPYLGTAVHKLPGRGAPTRPGRGRCLRRWRLWRRRCRRARRAGPARTWSAGSRWRPGAPTPRAM